MSKNITFWELSSFIVKQLGNNINICTVWHICCLKQIPFSDARVLGYTVTQQHRCTVQTVAADLRQGEHIPKMQNDIGHKSKLRMLRQRGGKEAGGGVRCTVPCRTVPCRATPRGAQPGAAFCITAVNLSQIEFGEFGSGSVKSTGRVQTDFLQISNLPLYQLRHTSLVHDDILDTTFTTFTILYYTVGGINIRHFNNARPFWNKWFIHSTEHSTCITYKDDIWRRHII